jgi:hypothetical protein
MYDAELEHYDHEDGRQTELQMAFARSRAEIQIVDETKKIAELVAQGKHVVASGYPVCCPSTDAYIGRTVCIDGVFDTRDEAMEFFNILCIGANEYEFDSWVSPTPKIERSQRELEDIFLNDDCPF